MGFEDLEVWQRGKALSVEIYRYFSNHQDFGFRDQITRSGLSIPSNIAEGYERSARKERSLSCTFHGSFWQRRIEFYAAAAEKEHRL